MATATIDLPPHRERAAACSPRQIMRSAIAAGVPNRFLMTHGPKASGAACLTFDDGPDPAVTPRVLAVLREHNIPATFFLIGRRAAEHPDLVQRIMEDGHALAHHSYTHAPPEQITAKQLIREVERTQELFVQFFGRRLRFFRPPYGKVTAAKLWQLWHAGQSVVLWNRDPKHLNRSTAAIGRWLAESPIRSGDLILLHDSVPHTAETLPAMLTAINAQGLRCATVDEWVGLPWSFPSEADGPRA